jgi:signal transduction histidine kinase
VRRTMNIVVTDNSTRAAAFEFRQLVADLFHQLSQPLTTLCCSLELALLQSPGPEQYGEIVTHALGQAEKVSSLATAIREVFDASWPGENCEVLDLRRAVEEAVTDLLPVAEAAGVQICHGPGPTCPVWFDGPRLRQGLFHLIGFVIRSGGAGAVVRIELVARDAEAILALTVSGGCGRVAPSAGNSDLELLQRLALGIARAIFEAQGGSFHAEHRTECLSVEVGVLLK